MIYQRSRSKISHATATFQLPDACQEFSKLLWMVKCPESFAATSRSKTKNAKALSGHPPRHCSAPPQPTGPLD
jgi:hypothetical protein